MKVARLTPSQLHELRRLIEWRMPKSWAHLPALPGTALDMRSVEALEKRGLVECIFHTANGITLPCYRITDEGRTVYKRCNETQQAND